MKIVSGGQTGVDRAALDAAMQLGIESGGWCPKGRVAEDGRIPDNYPLEETPSDDYSERTWQNVIDSDGTVIIYFGQLSGGTEQTLLFCINEKRPYLLIDAEEVAQPRASEKIKAFIQQRGISILNFAGPRASGTPLAYSFTKAVVVGLLDSNASSQ